MSEGSVDPERRREYARELGAESAHPWGESADTEAQEYGLSKREYIAALALQGLLARHTVIEPPAVFAACAVRHADELLAELVEIPADVARAKPTPTPTPTEAQHPDQPLVMVNGVKRFKENAIVRFLLDSGGYDMNRLAVMAFSDEDRAQFAQLIGYSLSGWEELSYVSDKAWKRVSQ